MNPFRWILFVIVISQFCCTSLWFASNGVMGELVSSFNLGTKALGNLTSAVQFGFISGTFIFAVLTISDRFSPSKVFFFSSFAGAMFNLGMTAGQNTLFSLLALRFLTGFFLAGIYPVGMKIAADYFDKGLGKSLGFLVGALVVGTALPHMLKNFAGSLPWSTVIVITSTLSLIGGLLMLILIPDGPFRKPGQKIDLSAFFKVFDNKHFRSAAFGYFGHMWELYAFWAFVPLILAQYALMKNVELNIPALSFLIIGIGGPACVISGYLSQKFGPKKIAAGALFLSCFCCILSPLLFYLNSKFLVIGILSLWGMVVIADSPLFSTLVAKNAEPESKGTALTIVNCIGFAITIVSIQLLNTLVDLVDPKYIYLSLAFGPILGLFALYDKDYIFSDRKSM